MSLVLDCIVAGFLCVSLAPLLVLTVECIASLLPRRTTMPIKIALPHSTAVVVPAHNEAGDIGATLDSIIPQLTPRDAVVVIADNCTDATAEIARARGATVLERTDPDHIGKSYALRHAAEYLRLRPPDLIVFIDADCTAEPGAIQMLVERAVQTGRPVQAEYRLLPPIDATPADLISGLACGLKNVIRPRGLSRLGLPCPLMGSGMAIPWRVLECANLASGRIAEDHWLGVDLALNGSPPVFCPDARVRGRLARTRREATAQRRRWAHGQLETLVIRGPHLLAAGARRRRLDLLALGLDVCVPPLSLAVTNSTAVLLVSVSLGAFSGSWAVAAWVGLAGALTTAAVLVSSVHILGDQVSLRALLSIPRYVVSNACMQLTFLFHRQRTWAESDR